MTDKEVQKLLWMLMDPRHESPEEQYQVVADALDEVGRSLEASLLRSGRAFSVRAFGWDIYLSEWVDWSQAPLSVVMLHDAREVTS